jgi:dTDP-4-dehydrorhamnose reductase
MRFLVTGCGGLLGSNIAMAAKRRGATAIATYHNREPEVPGSRVQFDITNLTKFEELLSTHEPDFIINCAAMTDVDGCEENPKEARRVNGDTPGKLAGIAADQGIGFVQVSTDYVFDGESDGRYEPHDETAPIQEYGRTKLLGERRVIVKHADSLIVRLSFVYGRDDTDSIEGFPGWVLDRLQREEETSLFTDQHITPTRAESAAETILELCGKGATGTFHVAARDCVTPYEFGTTLADLAGESKSLVTKGRMADIERAAERPRNTCLSVAETEAAIGQPQPTLEQDLRALL